MQIIHFYNPLTFKDYKTYNANNLCSWMQQHNISLNDYYVYGDNEEVTDFNKDYKLVAVTSILRGGGGGGKNIFKAIVGLALVAATGGVAAALFGGGAAGLATAHIVGAGLLMSGGGALLMGKMKLPSMDNVTTEDTKQGYQWNVGNLTTSRGIKGVTYGSNVIPAGELLKYQTFGETFINTTSRVVGHHWGHTGVPQMGMIGNEYNDWGWIEDRESIQTVKKSNSYLEMLIGAGEGALDSISDIKVNNLSIENVPDAKYEIRLGTNVQQPLYSKSLESLLSFQTLNQSVPVITSQDNTSALLISTPVECDSFKIDFTAPAWFLMNLQDGSKNHTYFDVLIWYRKQGSTTWIQHNDIAGINKTIPFKSLEPITLSSYFYPTEAGIYEVKIQNNSLSRMKYSGWIDDAEFANVPDRAAINLTCTNIACYSKEKQRYPNTALLWISVPASQIINGNIPQVTWKQSRHYIYVKNPANNSYEEKPADNLAWAIYDIFTQVRKDENGNFHFLGEDPDNIDYNKFVAFAAFCESINAKGNWFLTQTRPAWEHAQEIATSCRAVIGLRQGLITPYWDAAAAMTQIFTSGNILKGSLNGGYISSKDRATAIEATFNNEENKYESTTLRITADDIDDGTEAVKITFAGLSTPAAVYNQARYLLRRNKYLQQTVTFAAGIDSIVCEIGDIIGVQSDIAQWGAGGRIVSVDDVTKTVVLDAAVNLVGNESSLLIRHEDGSIERRPPDETSGITDTLHFGFHPFTTAVKAGEVYSFGRIETEVKPFRVETITRNDDLTATIECIEYNENVYTPGIAPQIDYRQASADVNILSALADNEAGTINVEWESANASAVQLYVNGKFVENCKNKNITFPVSNESYDIKLIPLDRNGQVIEDKAQTQHVNVVYPEPSAPPSPTIALFELSCNLTFYPIPTSQNISKLLIFNGNTIVARKEVSGDVCSLDVALPEGATKTLSARFVNRWDRISAPTNFEAKPTGIPSVVIQNNAIIASKIAAGSVTAEKLATDAIKSHNFVNSAGHYSQAGSFLNLEDGVFKTPYLGSDATGGHFKGTVDIGSNNQININDNQITFKDSAGNIKNYIKAKDNTFETKSTGYEYNNGILYNSNQFGYPFKYDIIINGNADTFYPVVIFDDVIYSHNEHTRTIEVTRNYTDEGPAEWYIATHRGALDLVIRCNFGGGGGTVYQTKIINLKQMYGNTFAGCYGLYMGGCAYVIFLRGGGAIYHLYSDLPFMSPSSARIYGNPDRPTVYYTPTKLSTNPSNYDMSPEPRFLASYRPDTYSPEMLAEFNLMLCAKTNNGNMIFDNGVTLSKQPVRILNTADFFKSTDAFGAVYADAKNPKLFFLFCQLFHSEDWAGINIKAMLPDYINPTIAGARANHWNLHHGDDIYFSFDASNLYLRGYGYRTDAYMVIFTIN